MPRGEPPAAKCPHTGVSVPECSCYRCLEEQIRRFMPALLERPAALRVISRPARRAPKRPLV